MVVIKKEAFAYRKNDEQGSTGVPFDPKMENIEMVMLVDMMTVEKPRALWFDAIKTAISAWVANQCISSLTRWISEQEEWKWVAVLIRKVCTR